MRFFLVLFTFATVGFLSSCSKSLIFKNTTNEQACTSKNGYWYKGKCWKEFEDEGVSPNDIDKVVKEELEHIAKAKITINEQTHPITFFFPEMGKKSTVFIVVYKNNQEESSIIMETKTKNLKSKEFDGNCVLFKSNIMNIDDESEVDFAELLIGTGPMHVVVNDFDKVDFSFKGKVVDSLGQKSYNLSFRTNEAILGAGTSHITIKGNEAFLNGDLGTVTYNQMKDVIDNHPEVKTIVLGNISGSVNDAVNMHTGRILREAGLDTKVLSTSEIASGGVDLFCAGNQRIVEKGAKIGIHSWCCINDLTAIELPKDHPAHMYQLDYFSMCLGKKLGTEFYFLTLEAAPFDDVHWMSDEDIQKWKVATTFLK